MCLKNGVKSGDICPTLCPPSFALIIKRLCHWFIESVCFVNFYNVANQRLAGFMDVKKVSNETLVKKGNFAA